jgi:choline dehydrogenase
MIPFLFKDSKEQDCVLNTAVVTEYPKTVWTSAMQDAIEADYVIVGGGTAGCVLANRLSEDSSVRVLLLEAGGGDGHPLVRMPLGFLHALRRPELSWGYVSEPEPHLGGRTIPAPHGKLPGGSSSINGMFHIRGYPLDFDGWRDAGCTGWGYTDVLPYFRRRAANRRVCGPYHGGSGPIASAQRSAHGITRRQRLNA